MSLKPRTVDFNQTWDTLQETVKGVVTLGNVPRAIWNDRFSDVYSLCVSFPEPLADRLYIETKAFLENHVQGLLDVVRSKGETKLLQAYHNCWVEYSQGIIYLHRLYLYLNTQHIRSQKLSEAEIIYGNVTPNAEEQMEIGELGLEVWKRMMIEPLRENLVNHLLEEIHKDRLGNPSDHLIDIVRGVIMSFVSVEEYRKSQSPELYQQIFEAPFLQATGEFYKREASKLLQECDTSQYMEKVTQRLDEERQRSQRFVHISTHAKVKAKCEQHMVADHLALLQSECHSMVVQERERDLALLYPLLRSVQGGISVLISEVMEHIKQKGTEAIAGIRGENYHVLFIESLLAVHNKYRTLISNVFNGDLAFIGALDKACISVVNTRPNPKTPCRSPELLAKYCDCLLKKSSKGISDTEIDEKLFQSITIFKYIDDKDAFQKFYARMLAKRLIHQQSQSMDAEEAMIDRLKQACGYEFTNKLHRMFTDISLSTDLNTKFNAHLKTESIDLGINFSIYVLQAGAWPLNLTSLSTFSVPQELEKSVQTFENFYHKHFNGRKLTWFHHLCQGDLKLGYLKKPYIITMQTFQMSIMLLFEDTDTMTCNDVEQALKLSQDVVLKHIASLIDCKLLLSEVPSENITPESVLKLNMDYSNKRTKLRITAAMVRDSPQEVEHTMNAINEDRKLYLQAAIVRIMKSRRVLRHNALIQEVLGQSKVTFAPSISMIKKCIESLIDKQYLERTPNSPDEYMYIA
ncbi:hypothetical protein ONE63_001789 [Megalurothrips usitatus]|uniref:Cullin-2 n=1 Tax=Megalurothrips usitatus TaxID=439358 RepID=A0AAV7XCL0_9NEOP|nr:hypothetical protein ONE63_001789 [Megalurothrips usitatus]